MTDILIQRGTVVDGTGAPAFIGDVRVRGGVIAEIGKDLAAAAGERVVDATGCIVSPGFIEPHTHMDAVMWWEPGLDPLPGYGVTTIVIGNCGFTAAPVHDDPEVRMEMVKIFSFFEEVAEKPFLEKLPWDWRTWSEYRASMAAKCKVSTNVAGYAGHIAIRLAVMGMDAWTRTATPDEIRRMCVLLEDAIDAGALGMSSNLMDHDSKDRAVPSLVADDAEWSALIGVLASRPGSQLQVILDTFFRLKAPEQMERLGNLCRDRNVRVQMAGAGGLLRFQDDIRDKMWKITAKQKEEGLDFWPSFAHVPPTTALNFFSSSSFAQANEYVWHEVVQAPTAEEKLALLNDPDFRARARDSWDNKAFRQSLVANPHMMLLMDSETGAGPLDLNLKELAEQRGVHPSDALADWVIANGVNSIVSRVPHPMAYEQTVEMLKDKQTVANISDAGAHGQMLCGGGENILLLTTYMKNKDLTLEEAIHVQTGKQAGHFNFGDRGVLKVGYRADIAVFNLDEIEPRPLKRVFDVPDGKGGFTWRFTRDAAPMRLTLVNGVPTFEGGAFTGALPGEFIGPVLAKVETAAA
ncbi:N-acyl-D-amino-acid deacylase family protein [Sphingomonas jatrophae]|uniref:N-acyl-D-aspartate/D-glutamate deacylase n=1 Tax=Sphingomonas jatrophae TaxID=1166337 RepID=A0A1I6M4X3_9SPHN|nr:amidohydrolase family protein [Sphingomonas jatrophae]SFS10719.1 N-acyl-D-aspartate/D-glutamate deacylase [Sphingomonas jatrophae]